ncbi:haloacid dehalogenase-like hydrolase [Pseudonocardia hierapolitana]|uniref:Haloacid dehalogenase-like hydrolase n=1 Tax=Pseudonocardia hierapolitana TaxID=1128676 RepID=A0A561SN65_9PSEU|nr:HAD family hydrolase [Pseudonocardia hierapolitana]TWF76301.1 haloacid dehalogenase-like hydrolase [Pseudonocardia hierapolitana]
MAGASQLESGAAALTGTAALVVLAYRLGSGQPAAVALGAAFAVLLVAVPAALRLATGLPRLVGTERANRLGVLVSGPDAFAAARQIRTVVIAGSDLVTGGELGVHAVHAVDGASHADVLRIAGAVARESGRPVDRAIAAATPRLPGVSDFDPVADLGARGVVAEVVGASGEEQRVIAHAVLVGDAELLAAHDIDLPAVPATAGCTPVAVAWDGVARGVLDVGPDVAAARAAAVHRLRALGLRPVLLTAEEAPVAQAVAARAGLAPDAVLAGVAPQHAAPLVRELGPGVAVIADPERYEAALDAAGIAVRRCATTATRPALTLVRGDLAAAVDAIRLARHTAAVIRTNLAWSLACVAALLPVTAAGLLGPSLSAAATAAGAAVLAVNSLRCERHTSTGG